jgi:hypothetical protein
MFLILLNARGQEVHRAAFMSRYRAQQAANRLKADIEAGAAWLYILGESGSSGYTIDRGTISNATVEHNQDIEPIIDRRALAAGA